MFHWPNWMECLLESLLLKSSINLLSPVSKVYFLSLFGFFTSTFFYLFSVTVYLAPLCFLLLFFFAAFDLAVCVCACVCVCVFITYFGFLLYGFLFFFVLFLFCPPSYFTSASSILLMFLKYTSVAYLF